MIRSRIFQWKGYGERTKIGRFRKVDRTVAKLASVFDPEGAKTPKGERGQAAQSAEQAGKECNGLEAWMQPDAGANQQLAAELKSRTSRKTGRQVSEVAGQEL